MPAHAPGRKFFWSFKAARLFLLFRQRRCEERILMTVEPAMFEDQMIPVRIHRECLSDLIALPRLIAERNVTSVKMVRINKHTLCPKGSPLVALRHQIQCAVRISYPCPVCACADQCDMILLYLKPLSVRTRGNVYDCFPFCILPCGFQRVTDTGKLLFSADIHVEFSFPHDHACTFVSSNLSISP